MHPPPQPTSPFGLPPSTQAPSHLSFHVCVHNGERILCCISAAAAVAFLLALERPPRMFVCLHFFTFTFILDSSWLAAPIDRNFGFNLLFILRVRCFLVSLCCCYFPVVGGLCCLRFNRLCMSLRTKAKGILWACLEFHRAWASKVRGVSGCCYSRALMLAWRRCWYSCVPSLLSLHFFRLWQANRDPKPGSDPSIPRCM